MSFRPRYKTRAALSAAALAPCSVFAYEAWPHASFVLWWIAGTLACGEFMRILWILDHPSGRPPARTAATADTAQSGAALSLLEHAPIALFSLDAAQPDTPATALNISAHRILAHSGPEGRLTIDAQLRAQRLGQRTLVWFDGEHGTERALLTASSLTLEGDRRHLIAWMPVENELEAEALGAWRELTHVLTHEIMNSLSPVASLSRTARALLEDVQDLLPDDVNEDLGIAFATIERRTTSLGQFVDSYRTLSSMPEPRQETVALQDVFARLSALVGAAWHARGGRAVFTVDTPGLAIHADPGQLEQALINLLKNAADATAQTGNPQVDMSARLSHAGRVHIDIVDNGVGVPDELASQIFLPFFSTKERSSGVGLAVARQLIHTNGGVVRYVKPLHGGAQFSVIF